MPECGWGSFRRGQIDIGGIRCQVLRMRNKLTVRHEELVQRVSERTGVHEVNVDEVACALGEILAEELLENGVARVGGGFTVTLTWRRNYKGYWEYLPNGRRWCPLLYPFFVLHIDGRYEGFSKPLKVLSLEWRRAYRNGWKVGEPAFFSGIREWNERHARHGG